jgi:hypothetical protein
MTPKKMPAPHSEIRDTLGTRALKSMVVEFETEREGIGYRIPYS